MDARARGWEGNLLDDVAEDAFDGDVGYFLVVGESKKFFQEMSLGGQEGLSAEQAEGLGHVAHQLEFVFALT